VRVATYQSYADIICVICIDSYVCVYTMCITDIACACIIYLRTYIFKDLCI